MTNKEKIKYWTNLSDENFRVAEDLLKSQHLLQKLQQWIKEKV
jgi:hypothetical protein